MSFDDFVFEDLCDMFKVSVGGGPGAVVKAACLESRWCEPNSGLQVSKKQNVPSPLTRKYSLLWGTSMSER